MFEEGHFNIVLEDILATDTYTFEYKIFGEANWESITLTGNSLILPAIDTCELLFYRFKSICMNEETDFSEIYSASFPCPDCEENTMCSIGASNYFEHIECRRLS